MKQKEIKKKKELPENIINQESYEHDKLLISQKIEKIIDVTDKQCDGIDKMIKEYKSLHKK